MIIENQKVVELTIATNQAKSGPVTLRDENGTIVDVLNGKIKITGDIQVRHNGEVVPNSQLDSTTVADKDEVTVVPQVKAG